jgi:hypothetical protein
MAYLDLTKHHLRPYRRFIDRKMTSNKMSDQLIGRVCAHPYLITSALISALAAPALYRDYQAYLALGRGGLPSNVLGWLVTVLCLRPFSLSYADRLNTADYPPAKYASSYARHELPIRIGPRAEAAGIVPHRQMTDLAPEEMAGKLSDLLKGLVEERQAEGSLEIKRSHYELHNDALYVAESVLQDEGEKGRKLPWTSRYAKGEAAHVHDDRSVHLYLHPADAKVVIEKGWGERHRLSRTWPWYLGGGKGRIGLAHTWILLYGPRDQEELEVVRRLLGDGVKWMLGEREE